MLQEWIVRLILILCRKYDMSNGILNADEVGQRIISFHARLQKDPSVELNFYRQESFTFLIYREWQDYFIRIN